MRIKQKRYFNRKGELEMAYTIVKYDMELWFDENKEAEVIKVVDCDLAISTNIMIDGKFITFAQNTQK